MFPCYHQGPGLVGSSQWEVRGAIVSLPQLLNIKLACQNAAEEQAKEHYDFSTAGGNKLGFTQEQLDTIKAALIHYARAGACEAFNYLKNHAYLKP